jgi:hypothetical protein
LPGPFHGSRFAWESTQDLVNRAHVGVVGGKSGGGPEIESSEGARSERRKGRRGWRASLPLVLIITIYSVATNVPANARFASGVAPSRAPLLLGCRPSGNPLRINNVGAGAALSSRHAAHRHA